MNIWGLLEVVVEAILKFIARVQGFWCEHCNNYDVETKLIDVFQTCSPGGISTTKVFDVQCPNCRRAHKAFIVEHNCTNMV